MLFNVSDLLGNGTFNVMLSPLVVPAGEKDNKIFSKKFKDVFKVHKTKTIDNFVWKRKECKRPRYTILTYQKDKILLVYVAIMEQLQMGKNYK
jgi:hypothetical protein